MSIQTERSETIGEPFQDLFHADSGERPDLAVVVYLRRHLPSYPLGASTWALACDDVYIEQSTNLEGVRRATGSCGRYGAFTAALEGSQDAFASVAGVGHRSADVAEQQVAVIVEALPHIPANDLGHVIPPI